LSKVESNDVLVMAQASLGRLLAYLQGNGFAGYDPYDALNSPVLRAVSLGTKAGRIAVIQALRRLPVNVRPLLGIRRGLNPKALGLFLGGYARLSAISGNGPHTGVVDELLRLLEEVRSPGYSGNCWGYNFDWQSRAFFVPRATPTVVNSAFIGHALLDAYELCGSERALALALPIREFILRDLNRTADGDVFAFSYTPIDRLAVHNANLLGASLLIRLDRFDPSDDARRAALAALAYSLKHQRDDGSWPYAETDFQGWIDSFHTGFNLESIEHFIAAGVAPHSGPAFEKGVEYYATHFFLADGTPKYYHDRIYPIDVHAPAEAVAFFARQGERYAELTDRALGWMVENMQHPSGYFVFRKGRFWTNQIAYIRWGQAWAFRALTEYVYRRGQHGGS
jgi:hypothetical protein